MDGYETAEYIRGRERSARTPIIFLTAVSTDMPQVLRGYEAGAVDYVLKPFDPVVLRSKVAVFAELERHRRGRERADELLRRAWESSPTGVVLVDDEGRIVRSNPAFGARRRPGRAGRRIGPRRALPPRRPAGAGRALPAGARRAATPTPAELRLTAADGDRGAGRRRRARPSATPTATCARSSSRSRTCAPAAPPRRRSSARPPSARRATRPRRSPGAWRASRRSRTASTRWSSPSSSRSCAGRLHEVLGARGAAVRVVDPGGAVVADAERGSADVAGRALRQALADGRGLVELDDGTLAVPLRAGGELFGAVAVAGPNGATPAGQRGALVAHAAERAALIIRRALLLEREQHVASTLQHDLLPQSLPDLPGVSLAAHFRAGGHGIEVGGDWYDVIPLAGGRVGLVVGDVAGRGVAAAARMGQLRSVARAYALEGHAPAAFAQRMNVYHRALSPDDLTTLVYAVIEPDVGRLRFVNAGHPPPLLVPAAARRGCSRASTPPLGVSDLPVHPETVVDFPPGSAVVLYTDGLIERRGEGVDIGLRRLLVRRRRRAATASTPCASASSTAASARRAATTTSRRCSSAPSPTSAPARGSRSPPTATRSARCGGCCAAGSRRPARRPTTSRR